jgi:F-type H+-transporting ATPase subunit delta
MQTLSRRKLATYIASELTKGSAVKPLLQKAASYLIEHKQVGQVDLLVRDIEAILARDHGIVLAQVISARALSAGLLKNIEQFVKGSESAKQVEVATSVDPSLLGGVIIRTPRAELDTTVRKQLNDLRSYA